MFVFGVIGFRRGWRREVLSLVFVLLAVVLVHPDTSAVLNGFLIRLENAVAYLSGSGPLTSPPSSQGLGFLGGPSSFWSLVIFGLIVALGYYIGYKVFEGPKTPHERFLGIIPALISGAFILFFLNSYETATGSPGNRIEVPLPDPSAFVSTIVIIGIITLITAFIASRLKKKK
jgi:hypothetical protein